MQNNLWYNSGGSIYPGEYVPLLNENDINEKIKHLPKEREKSLPVNIEDMATCYKIELPVPGVKREDFFISSYGNILSISVFHDNCELLPQENFQLLEFNYAYRFNRKIVLPDDADPVFISAEYKAGVLRLHIPKSAHPLKWANTKIAIY
ncbi:MAG TPA: Hsp20/alpha crystallin family protein [Hanamia sp.]|jgi:HSP20 family protein|nr:Hsp20/alpha crystallin family protein [Hanamia sp.]